MIWDFDIDLDKPEEKARLMQLIKDSSGRMVIYAEPVGSLRSIDLSNYYFVLLDYISDYTGIDQGYLHNFYKNMFIPVVKWRIFGRISTTNLSTKKMLQYLGWVRAHALSEFGIKTPDPEKKQIVRPK